MEQNKAVVIVTGASRGLGAAVAKWLGKAGAAVSLVARSEKGLEETTGEVAALGGLPIIVARDVGCPEDCRLIVEETVQACGRVDALVNNAGVFGPMATVASSSPAEWRRNLEVNLLGPYCLSKFCLPWLRKRQGRIVNVSSGAAEKTIAAGSAYCSAKAALNHFTRVLAVEEPSVTCVAVRPGVVDTAMQEALRRDGPRFMPAEQAAFYLSLKKEGRLEPPLVPARSVAWLALHAPREFSGKFVNYDDATLQAAALETLGTN